MCGLGLICEVALSRQTFLFTGCHVRSELIAAFVDAEMAPYVIGLFEQAVSEAKGGMGPRVRVFEFNRFEVVRFS